MAGSVSIILDLFCSCRDEMTPALFLVGSPETWFLKANPFCRTRSSVSFDNTAETSAGISVSFHVVNAFNSRLVGWMKILGLLFLNFSLASDLTLVKLETNLQ